MWRAKAPASTKFAWKQTGHETRLIISELQGQSERTAARADLGACGALCGPLRGQGSGSTLFAGLLSKTGVQACQ